jgi:enoyl-CoA hydratase
MNAVKEVYRMSYEYETLLVNIDNGIAVVSINRPKALNALNSTVFKELGAAFDEMENDDRVRVVILTGEGDKAFAAGADITEMMRCSVIEAKGFALVANRTQGKVEVFPKPVIAAIHGFALGGGCELAMACDIRIASTTAKFGQPEINLAIIPGGGGTQRLPRLIGLGRAKELVYTGGIINAERAYELGLVNKVVPPEKVMEEAQKMASKMVTKSLPILRLAKEAMNCGANLDLDRALQFEMECFASCFGTDDQTEGMSAFTEKRTPSFSDK